MLQNDEIIVSDILNEYHNNFAIQKDKINNCRDSLGNNLLVDKTLKISIMINQKILEQFEDFADGFSKLENWWGRYLDCTNELNSGLISNIRSTSSDNSAYLEAKKLLNDEIE